MALVLGLGVAVVPTSPAGAVPLSPYLSGLARDTYRSIVATIEPTTGLANDKLDASIMDVVPQLAVIRRAPYPSTATGATLTAQRCTAGVCVQSGTFGLQLDYQVPPGTFASYNFESARFNAGSATQLELWAKGAAGGERFEVVLWSNCSGPFPGRPPTALIQVTSVWQRFVIPMADFRPFVSPSSLCRLSIGFNDAIHPGGRIHLDKARFLNPAAAPVRLSPDEETSVTNIGLAMASILGARELGWETPSSALSRLSLALRSVERLRKFHGFPQTHNRVVSLAPSDGDRCISTVDTGYLAVALILVRQQVPELASRASALLNAMDWAWLYDSAAGLPYGCRYPDGSTSSFHYDYLEADSRLAHLIGIGSRGMPKASWKRLRRGSEAARCAGTSHLEPGWLGGGLFMAYLPGLFLRDGAALRDSAVSLVDDQICIGRQLSAPGWGWSATALPPYGEQYCGFGCQRDDVLVPHASVLANEVRPVEANLQALEALGARAPFRDGTRSLAYGFRASVNWQTLEVATTQLVLDQSMAFLALVNHATEGRLRAMACADALIRRGTALVPDYAGSC